MKEDSRPLMVTIRCCTYNHENYIRQCLDGFVMQKTNFRFEAIVHDDASTDGTALIIREYAEKYPEIIKPIFENENLYSKRDGSLKRIMKEHTHGKYIAICEGDDYWIDPQKLQKQVDFLESNTSYSMIHTHFIFQYPAYTKNDEALLDRMKSYESYEIKDLMYAILDSNRYRVQTCTVLFRKSTYDKIFQILESENGLFMMGDTQFWIRLLSIGRIKYLQDVTSVYRVVHGSASHHSSITKRMKFAISCYEMRYYYANEFNVRKNIFYYRYLKELVKILAVDPNYRTNPRIFAKKIDKIIAQVVSSPLVVKLAKLLFVDSYISKQN